MRAIAKLLLSTDFSAGGAIAFERALRLAVKSKARLYTLHVESKSSSDEEWGQFRHMRSLLGCWTMTHLRKPPRAIEAELGI